MKGKGGKGVGGVDDYHWEEGAEAEAWEEQQADEGGSVWDADEDESALAVDDAGRSMTGRATTASHLGRVWRLRRPRPLQE